MSSSAYSAILNGLHPIIIEAEVEQTPGLPTLQIIGLATHAVSEAKQRITTALIHQKLMISNRRTIVNLAPTDIKKSSPGLDLAIVIALLEANNILSTDVSKILFLGEIALDGRLKSVQGILPIITKAKQLGFTKVIIPNLNRKLLTLISDIEIICCQNLQQVLLYLKTGKKITHKSKPKRKIINYQNQSTLNTILGHQFAKRGLQLAAAGNHHLLFIGPPGSGKTKLAQSLIEILPELTSREQLEAATIQSIQQTTITQDITRPFRTPHHTISNIGLLGGGTTLKPGEVSLAHNGVLFLDEITEFNRAALEALRQPLTEKKATITRTKGNATYPANFHLVAACNPCPCGFYGSSYKTCICSPAIRKKYFNKLSGPLLDRIDMVIWVEPEKQLLASKITTLNIKDIRDRVESVQKKKANIGETLTDLTLLLNKQALNMLEVATTNQNLSTRALIKTIQLAQTIHYFDENPRQLITKQEILEALQYRWKDQTN